jgi:excisionase family DNA binding protein
MIGTTRQHVPMDSMAGTAEPPIAYRKCDAARLLGVSTRTLSRLIKAGELPEARIGQLRMIRRSDLEALLDRRTATPASPEPSSASNANASDDQAPAA